MKLWHKVIAGMVLGIIVGLTLKEFQIKFPEYSEYFTGTVEYFLTPLGQAFIRMIKMLIVPLIFFSLISGVTSIGDPKKMGRIGLKATGSYLITTAFAITIGLSVGYFLKPGEGVELNLKKTETVAAEAPSFADTLVQIIPINPINAFAEANILQIIVFALLFGFCLTRIGEKGQKIIDMNNALAEATYKLTDIVMKLAPYGVFGLMATVAAEYGLDVLLPLLKVIGGVYGACILHMILVYGMILAYLKLSPARFFKKMLEVQAVAYTTSSSSGTLPVTMRVAQEELGVSKEISSFTLPLGTTINMDGTALYQGVSALFVAQAMGVVLTGGDYITIILTSTLASIGSAGVPGAGLIMLSLVLTSIGLPVEGIAIIAGVDRILDMMRTVVNVTGDSVISILVDKTEGSFDKQIYDRAEIKK